MLSNIPELLGQLKTQPENYWLKKGQEGALTLFHEMAERVPAYQDFLKKENIDHQKIKTYDDFQRLPTIDKENYLKQYPLDQLCWDGEFQKKHWVFSATSGSTGVPFYFPRQSEQDLQYALTAELYLLENFQIDKRSTLYIDGFAMGAWIGGLFTYSAIHSIAEKGNYPLSIITPGVNKSEILKAVKQLGGKYDQILIGGYPPMVKDLIDEGLAEGLEWSKYQLGFIFSAEAFSESFRDYIFRKTGLTNIYKDTLNHYGTVDLGTMAHETPLSILIRRLTVKHETLYSQVFSDAIKLPTLAQFFPELFFFEENEQNLICSARSGLPLVRYDLKDHGGVITLEEMGEKLLRNGIDIKKETKKEGIYESIWNLPFVYVYERSDLSVSLYGGNIYPETVRKAMQIAEFETALTGKFAMLVKNDEKQNSYLEINVELKPRAHDSSGLKKDLEQAIVGRLLKENSEYRVLHENMGSKVLPKIQFWPYENHEYFNPAGKQKWVKKS